MLSILPKHTLPTEVLEWIWCIWELSSNHWMASG